ncbi:MAG: feruloyl-CoA synthase [Burkholderiales bacterium]|nr:feruloyl-CoA synthase [Burkholderiales bacterium]
MNAPRYRQVSVGGCVEAAIEPQADGSLRLRSTEPLGEYPQRLTDRLVHWAQAAPERTFAAQRDGTGAWRRIGYAQMLGRVRAVAQSLLDLGLSAERPVAILSGNDLEHLTLSLGAMWAGVPTVPISPAYSLVSQDFAKLRHVLGSVTPGLVYASDAAYARAIAATVDPALPLVLGTGAIAGRGTQPFEALLAATPGPALDAAHARVGPDTIAKLLFTSGSTREPKGVITTQRMLCSNQQMLRQCMPFLAEPQEDGGGPVLLDWLPWNHVFGGSHNVGIALYNGGTLYIDEGKPTPAGIAHTLRNLREISPTIYFNVPRGLEEIAQAMDSDPLLRASLFRRCRAIMFAGAALSQAVWDRLHAHAEAAVGERVRIVTGLGMTETAPACTFAVGTEVASGHIGLPAPGVEVRLVPEPGPGGKTEIRFRGPNVTPGYWRAPQQTAEAFDAEGYYRTGDAVRWIDAGQPQRGLRFDGRLGEDFKLASGTFVSVGPLRARIVAEGDPCVQDAVITGLNRNELGALIVPRLDACRALAGTAEASLPELLRHPRVRAFFQALADRLWAGGTGSATRVARLALLAEPPALDRGEITDKGSINQRAVLMHRAAQVDALHAADAGDALTFLPAPTPTAAETHR